MTRQPPPPRTNDPLDRLFERLAAEIELIRFDPALPRRVEEAARRASPPRARERRCVPRWAVIAAAVLVALGVGTGSAAGRRAASLPAAAPVDLEGEAPPRPASPEAPSEGDEKDPPTGDEAR